MKRLGVAAAIVVWATSPASADTAADVKAAFAAYVESVQKKQPAKTDLFIGFWHDSETKLEGENLDELAGAIAAKPKITYLAVVPSASGKSAWLAAELPATVKVRDKTFKKLRASGMFVLDGTTWRASAVHFGLEVKDVKPGMCGMFPGWNIGNKVPKELASTVQALVDGIEDSANKRAKLRAQFSDDKRALLLGSGPGEKWVGGAKIKGVYQGWPIHYGGDNGDDHEDDKHAAIAPDGTLMWAALPVNIHKFCQTYRGFFVFAKEPAGWRAVLHHYSAVPQLTGTCRRLRTSVRWPRTRTLSPRSRCRRRRDPRRDPARPDTALRSCRCKRRDRGASTGSAGSPYRSAARRSRSSRARTSRT
jgi:hypothetical protein